MKKNTIAYNFAKYLYDNKQNVFEWTFQDAKDYYYNKITKKQYETAKQGEWRLDFNGDKDYPYSLFVVVDYWDDITQDLANKILSI